MSGPDWRAGNWRLVEYDAEFFAGKEPPASPTAEAELAQPSCWASLWDGRRIVATWYRDGDGPIAPSAPDATIAAS